MSTFMNKKFLVVGIILSVLSGLMIPFSTWAYSEIFALVAGKQVSVVIETIGFIIVGMIVLSTFDWLYERSLNQNIAEFNQNVRTRLMTTDFIKPSHDGVSDRTSFLNNDLDLVENNYIRQAFTIIQSVTTVVFTLAVALRGSVLLTVIFIAFGSITPFIPRLFKNKIEASSKQWSTATSRYVTFMSDLMRNINAVFSYNAFPTFVKRGQNAVSDSVQTRRKRDNVIANSNFAAEAFAYTMTYLPIGIGIIMVIRGNVTLASFVAVQYSSSWIINIFLGIARARSSMNSAKPSIDKILAYTPLDSSYLNADAQSHTSIDFSTLTMDDVSFTYAGADSKQILNDINFSIRAGEKVLLTGTSGAGKSTFLNILTGELTPSHGQVEILRASGEPRSPQPNMFSVVRQDSSIFTDTLGFNLTLGRQFSDQAIAAAMQKAGLTDFLASHGLNYVFEENGSNLSGGEKKRIELARAFLYAKNFLVIDEGTASLDPQTADDIHNILLESPLTILEIDHHIDPQMQHKFNRHLQLADGQIEPIA